MTTLRERVERLVERHYGRHVTLVQARHRGRRVYAAQCAQHAYGVHRYTLTSGMACADWWPTLRAAAQALGGDRP